MEVQAAKAETPKSLLHTLGRWFSDALDREDVLGYILTAPALILLAALVGYPFVLALYFSLTDKVLGKPETFVGLNNYVNLWKSDIFQTAFKNTFVYTGFGTVFKVIGGVGLALLLNQRFRFRNQIRALLLLPWIVPTVLIVLVWWWMMKPPFSVINWALESSGLVQKGPPWLSDPGWARASTILVQVWRALPYYAITILAGLQAIPKELYEAASIDGASPLQQLRHITLPLLSPVLTVVVTLGIIWTFADLELVYVLTGGGPFNSTHLLATLSYRTAIFVGKMGEGSAISLYMFPVLLAMMIIYIRRLRRG
jgi:multiple sugar transport system permease protein